MSQAIEWSDITLAQALMTLRGETLRTIETATGIKPSNLSIWLKGKPQVISQARIALLLNYLGVNAYALRTDIIHDWRSELPVSDLESLLAHLGVKNPADRELYIGPEMLTEAGIWQHTIALMSLMGKKRVAIRFTCAPSLVANNQVDTLNAAKLAKINLPTNEFITTTPSDFYKQLQDHVISATRTEWWQPEDIFAKAKPFDELKKASKRMSEDERYQLGSVLNQLLDQGVSVADMIHRLNAQ